MILHTERLSLRPLEADDAPAIHAMMSDAEVMAFWDSSTIEDPAVTAEIVERQLGEVEEERALFWSMLREPDQTFLGVCDLFDIDRWHGRAEVGFMVGRAHWGGGYAQEAMHAVVGHAAHALRLKRLQARVHVGNQHSMQLLEQLGFRREGLMRGYVERDGERRDCLVFGLTL